MSEGRNKMFWRFLFSSVLKRADW